MQDHRRRNLLQSLLLVGGMNVVVALAAAMIWSWQGAIMAALLVSLLSLLGPKVAPSSVMRLYHGVPVDARSGHQLHRIVEVLADRAELSHHPQVYVIPSTTLNAFAAGTTRNAAIGVTEGLLRSLDLDEIAGVMAHEMSHIRNNDLKVMALADALTRFTQLLAYLAVLLALLNIPALLLDTQFFPWTAILLLYLTPTLMSLLQMGLSRAREYDADIEAVGLTGNPDALIRGLKRLEAYQGRIWEDLTLPVPARRIPHPSLLRSHPATAERIQRLEALKASEWLVKPMRHADEPFFTLVGHGPAGMTPRHRLFGIWF
ncbi:MAG: M48 family metalloprotease [Proteobacteria bacterium]|nr:M48 family metalloprotease [Pseudomonadota bacterium]